MTDEESYSRNDGARIDLRALDPDIDALASERFVRAVMSRVAGSPASPAIPLDPLYGLWSMPRHLLLAASILVVAILGLSRGVQEHRARPATVAEAVGVPPELLTVGAPHP